MTRNKSKYYIKYKKKLSIKCAFQLLRTYFSNCWSWYCKNEIDFIKKFSKIHTVKYTIPTVSGTVALECILTGMGIGAEDEVIVPIYTWISTATAVLKVGAIPVFVDIDKDTLCILPEEIEKAITDKTKAIIPVHLFSAVCDMDKITEIAIKHNLKIIEDCAHSHGATYNNKGTGSIGDAGAFSFQHSKIMNCGEGGAVVTNNVKLADYISSITHIGWSIFKRIQLPPKDIICSKLVFTEFQACLLSYQCNTLVKDTLKKMKKAEYFESLFSDFPYIRFQKTSMNTTRRSYYCVTFMLNLDKLKQGLSKYSIIDDLKENGVYIENGWGVTVDKHELWNISNEKIRKLKTYNAENIIYNEVLTIPHEMLMLPKYKIKVIANIIKQVIEKYKKE